MSDLTPELAEMSDRFDETTDSSNASGLEALVIVARRHGVHLSVPQLLHDNVLGNHQVSIKDLISCASKSGLKAKAARLSWDELVNLKRALPVIARLRNGNYMILTRVDAQDGVGKVVLQDPEAGGESIIRLDRIRWETVWAGDVILVRRDYGLTEEKQPFGFRLITGLIFRERWIARDIALSAVVLGLLALAPIIFWQTLSHRVVYFKAYQTFYVLCCVMAMIVLFEAVFYWLRRFLLLNLTSKVDVKLSTYIFDRVLNLPMEFFERTPVGKITYDMSQLFKIRTFLMGQLFGTVLDSVTLIFFFLPVMFYISPTVTAVVLAVSGIIVLWLVLMLPVNRRKSTVAERAESDRGAFLVQTIHGMRTVKSLSLEARQRHLWDVHVAKVARMRFAEGMTGNLIQSVVKPLERLAVSGSLALAVYFTLTTDDPTYSTSLFAFVMLTQRVVGPLMQMAQLVSQYDEARNALDVVSHLVNQPDEEGRAGNGVRTPLVGHVEFSGVNFKYKNATSPALQNVSFQALPGTKIGVMGRSGSGKTTVTRLLQRIQSNYEGLIKIDGIDVREYDIDHLRRSIGVVLQENFLFSGTIRDNIAAAKSDASFEEVVRAARLAGAEEFIDRLPRGYETYIYEGSPNLSGGQRQRIAIARALIVDPRILILDEATSALDPESEAIINNNISRIAHGRTLIMISHRLASLISSDAILVLDAGKVLDSGKHEDLLQRCEVYARLWAEQNSHLTSQVQRRAKPPFRNPSLVS